MFLVGTKMEREHDDTSRISSQQSYDETAMVTGNDTSRPQSQQSCKESATANINDTSTSGLRQSCDDSVTATNSDSSRSRSRQSCDNTIYVSTSNNPASNRDSTDLPGSSDSRLAELAVDKDSKESETQLLIGSETELSGGGDVIPKSKFEETDVFPMIPVNFSADFMMYANLAPTPKLRIHQPLRTPRVQEPNPMLIIVEPGSPKLTSPEPVTRRSPEPVVNVSLRKTLLEIPNKIESLRRSGRCGNKRGTKYLGRSCSSRSIESRLTRNTLTGVTSDGLDYYSDDFDEDYSDVDEGK